MNVGVWACSQTSLCLNVCVCVRERERNTRSFIDVTAIGPLPKPSGNQRSIQWWRQRRGDHLFFPLLLPFRLVIVSFIPSTDSFFSLSSRFILSFHHLPLFFSPFFPSCFSAHSPLTLPQPFYFPMFIACATLIIVQCTIITFYFPHRYLSLPFMTIILSFSIFFLSFLL